MQMSTQINISGRVRGCLEYFHKFILVSSSIPDETIWLGREDVGKVGARQSRRRQNFHPVGHQHHHQTQSHCNQIVIPSSLKAKLFCFIKSSIEPRWLFWVREEEDLRRPFGRGSSRCSWPSIGKSRVWGRTWELTLKWSNLLLTGNADRLKPIFNYDLPYSWQWLLSAPPSILSPTQVVQRHCPHPV